MWYNVRKCRTGGDDMAKMYFYKFNINSEIYDVYADPNKEVEILREVFGAIKTDLVTSKYYKDDDGNERVTEYKFCDLEKDVDNLIITGRLVKIFDGEVQSYDRRRDTVETRYETDRAASATFTFDVLHEEIAFITRLGLGYLQFGIYFRLLLEEIFPENAFELVLEKNVGHLREKVYALNRILKVSTTIIPPNANEKEFGNLLGASVEEFRETGSTKYTQEIEVPTRGKKSIDSRTRFFDRIFYAVGKGYATMHVVGRDYNNEDVSIDSDKDAPYRGTLPEKEKDSIIAFKERANIGITQLLLDKQKITLPPESGEDSEGKQD